MRKRLVVCVIAGLMVQLKACAPAEESVPAEPTVGTSTSAPAEEATRGAVAVAGAQLRYVIEGEGPPCLVIGSSIYYPRTFSQNLRNHLQLIFVDLRHFAPSDGSVPVDAISLDTYADDIDQVRSALGFERVAVMGHSMQGMMALEYARRYPERVTRIIALGSPPVGFDSLAQANESFWESDASEERKLIQQQNIDGLGAEEYARISKLPDGDAVVKYYVAHGPWYWYDATYDSAPLWQSMFVNIEIFHRVVGLLSSYDLARGAGEIAAPVFVAMGRYDYAVPYILWDDEKDKLADLTFLLLEESGHTPQLEEPAVFDAALLEWWSSH